MNIYPFSIRKTKKFIIIKGSVKIFDPFWVNMPIKDEKLACVYIAIFRIALNNLPKNTRCKYLSIDIGVTEKFAYRDTFWINFLKMCFFAIVGKVVKEHVKARAFSCGSGTDKDDSCSDTTSGFKLL